MQNCYKCIIPKVPLLFIRRHKRRHWIWSAFFQR